MAYSELIATEIITRVSNGETLRAICRSHDEFPDESTVRQWYSENVKGFAPRYARAREAQAEAWSDEIIEVADAELKEGANRDEVNRARLRVDTRKWLMAKLHPRSYGEKIEQQITGKGGEPLVISWKATP